MKIILKWGLLVVLLILLGYQLKSDIQSVKRPTEITLRMGYVLGDPNPRHSMAQAYSKWVNDKTKGKVKIELFPNEVIGYDQEMVDMVVMGGLDMMIAGQGVIANYEPKISAVGLPFLFAKDELVDSVLDGPIGKEIAKDLPSRGLHLLAYWDNGFRQISNNRHPIFGPEDIKGLKIRVPVDRMSMSIIRTMGANPIPLPFAEVYISLQRGEIDGQENPIVNIYSAKLYEVQKYLTVINYKYESNPLIISEKTWRRLPLDVQQILVEGALYFAVEHRRLNRNIEKEMVAELEQKGMKVVKPDIGPFRRACLPVYTEWELEFGKDFLEKIVAAAQ